MVLYPIEFSNKEDHNSFIEKFSSKTIKIIDRWLKNIIVEVIGYSDKYKVIFLLVKESNYRIEHHPYHYVDNMSDDIFFRELNTQERKNIIFVDQFFLDVKWLKENNQELYDHILISTLSSGIE